MNKKFDDFNPILSQSERDLIFTDPGTELSGTFSGKTVAGKALRKKPWFAQKMNIQGRFLQLLIIGFVALAGFGLGLQFLKVPFSKTALTLLLEHGYRGPYEKVQVIDARILPSITGQPDYAYIEITLFNFEDAYLKPTPLQVSIEQNTLPRIVHHPIECCDEAIKPFTKYTLRKKISGAHRMISSIKVASMKP